MTRTTDRYYAIDSRSDEGHGFIGIHFVPDVPGVLCGTALFKTTQEASPTLKAARASYPKAKLVKVRIAQVLAGRRERTV